MQNSARKGMKVQKLSLRYQHYILASFALNSALSLQNSHHKSPVRLYRLHKKRTSKEILFIWPWRESNPRQTRFRKPPLYPTELQSHFLFNFITKTAPLEKPACICHRKRNTVFLDSTSVAFASSACP